MRTRFCLRALPGLALALALVLCLGVAAWADAFFPNAVALTLGVEAKASIQNGGDIAYFRFTPSETQRYMFFSEGGSDTYGYLYDAAGNLLASDDDSGSDSNFKISRKLEAGTTYYFGAKFFSSSGTGSFGVRIAADTLLYVEPDNKYPIVKALENLTMTAIVSGGTPPYTYRWYTEDSDDGTNRTLIDGATASSYTWRAEGCAPRFICEVTDASGATASAVFSPEVENGAYVHVVGPHEYYVPFGETIELHVEAGCDVGSMSYRWFTSENHGNILSFTDTVTTEPVTYKTYYICEVSDEYGFNSTAEITVYVANELTVSPEDTVRVPIALGGSGKLTVKASCLHGVIHYTWHGPDWGVIKTDTGARSDCPVSNIQEAVHYICEVADDYGNEKSVWFDIYVDNGFTAHAEGTASAEEVKYVTIKPGGTAQLKVIASCNPGTLQYSWTDPDWENCGDTSAITVRSDGRMGGYLCNVWDDYGNRATIEFRVRRENAFSAEAAGKTIVRADRGGTVTFSVKASCRDGALDYKWYKHYYRNGDTFFDIVEGEEGPSVTVEMNARLLAYYCIVSDQYGNQERISFLAVDPDIVLPEGLRRIESEAFAGMKKLVVWAPPSVTEIAPDAFDPSTYVIGEPGSYAEEYAEGRASDEFVIFLEEDE